MSNQKTYICVTPFFPSPGNWRGAYVLDQIKAIKRNSNYNVVVFVDGKKQDYEIDGVKVYHYKTHELPSNILNGIFNEYNSNSFVSKVLKVGVDLQNVEIVHCHVAMHAACGLALKKINPSIKVLLQHHCLDPFNLRSGVIGRYNRFNIRYRATKAVKLYNKVDLHICISEACRDNLLSFPCAREHETFDEYLNILKLVSGIECIKPKHTYVLYNGVDTGLFNSTVRSQNIFRIGCIANFQQLKDQMTLIKAFERLVENGYNDIFLSLLGTGETRQMCESYIAEHRLTKFVEWPAEVTHDKLPEYYQSLSLFVLPSYYEGFGCVYTEAAACGVPFMGCMNQGYSEYILESEKEKWLIAPHDSEKLAQNIENYYKNPVKQNLAKDYNIDVLIRHYLKYLQDVIF